MKLSEIRNKINTIDDRMKQLFDERLICSWEVAKVKINENDEVFKPLREKEIHDRFTGEEENGYLAYVSKVIQISRKYQYKCFIESNKEEQKFIDLIDKSPYKGIFKSGGLLRVSMNTDDAFERALDTKGVISMLSDTGLTIKRIRVEEDYIEADLYVDNNKASIEEAYLTMYMLYKETINFCFI